MKKILLLILVLFISMKSFSIPMPHIDKSKCPIENCDVGMIMDDHGKCHSCDEDDWIRIECEGHNKVLKKCPNRYTQDGSFSFSLPSKKECSGSHWLYFFVPLLKLSLIDTHNHICDTRLPH